MRSGSPESLATAQHPAGFRLARFELLNWGTFHGRVWKIEPGGENSLLTGDIGSGKSTIVDALTTLLVPPRKLAYNRAAGAETKERTLHSYVRGEYRSVSNELTGAAQAQALRGENTYSVILGVFSEPNSQHTVTLAQVFWTKLGERVPARFYVVADRALSIAAEFAAFGDDIQSLRKRLRAERIPLFDSFEEYGTKMRRELGIPHPQALELFHQTVSMKSVGNLTEFVRRHMLEEDDTHERIKALLANFENLNRAHDAVIQARRQIEALDPLVANGERLAELEARIAALRQGREALAAWFAGHRVRLLDTKIEELSFDLHKCEQQLEAQKARVDEISSARAALQAAIERQGGGRIRELETEIHHRRSESERQRVADEDYRKLCSALDIRAGTSLEAFLGSTRTAQTKHSELETEKRRLDLEIVDKAVELKEGMEQDKALKEEIQSLESRKNNIPTDSIRIREALAEALQVDVEELPFAGELLQVRKEEEAWEAAIERLLYGFALSLLVSEELYGRVSHYVDRTHLRGRLVYLRTKEAPQRSVARAGSPQAVARKLAIKSDSGFYAFLERELVEHFDHVCCERLEEFHRLPKALTINGQVKSQDRRHEKDDRRTLGDRSRYVLGWDNRAKLKALREQQTEVRRRLLVLNGERQKLDRDKNVCEQRLRAAERLLELKEFSVIDWRGTVAAIEKLEEEKRAIEESDDALRTLRAQLAQLNADYEEADAKRQDTQNRRGGIQERLREAKEQHAAAVLEAGSIPENELAVCTSLLEEWRVQVLGNEALQLRSLDSQQQRVRTALQAKIDSESSAANRLRENIVKQMQQYKAAYPAETAEMDARTEALPEYQRRLQVLREDDLPRFEAHFKELLNKETINGMAAFQAHLQRRRHDIEERIRTINGSLASIEYDRSQGTFIELVSLPSSDPAVRDFQTELRACISGGEDGGELYNEQKFLEVKALLERMQGREGQADLDARWREKVTDVRNWFEFGAKERWRADGAEREFYRDSSGKSGGQKEKLAYTILGAALAYQFGLAETGARNRHFRFVTIDEAFGRGSDDSTRYGLELFETLNLQLLIVTPLQKIAVIEDYISAVHFVHNEGGASSMVQNLTIEEYRERRQEFLVAASS